MSFQQGLSGLNAASKYLDAIGNNVSNSSTVGFKGASVQFEDVFAAVSGGGSAQTGIGVSMSDVKQNFTQGNITVTNNPLDVAINGQGFYRMSNAGSIAYSRNGQFLVDRDGYIVNGSGHRLTGYQADTNGVIVPSSPVDLVVSSSDLSPEATTSGTIGMNLDSRETEPTAAFDYTDPTSYNSSTALSVYDGLGNSHVLTLYFRKSATANSWEMYTVIDGDSASQTGPTSLDFDSSGVMTTAMPLTAETYTLTNGAADLSIEMDFTGSTQYGSTFGVNRLTQDGLTSGRLAGLSISEDGVIQGRYSNGQSRDLGQIVLANFANPSGLQSLGGNQWAETPASGQPLVGAPNTGSLGALQSAAVEESNIDLTAELVNMITAQRAYQANAQSIKTQDAVMQTLVNMR